MNKLGAELICFFIRDKQKREKVRKMLLNFDADDSIKFNILNRINQTNLSTMQLHRDTFLRYKAINTGKNLVICATGPSAKHYKPINAVHIGVNAAILLNDIDFNYYFIQDFSGKTPEYIDKLNEYRKDECQKFYGLTTEYCYEPERTIPEIHALRAGASRYRTDWVEIEGFESKFAYDISSQPLGCFGSVVFPALQFALWTHPKTIYLVGCDCSLSGYAYNKGETNFLIPENMIYAYSEFKRFAYKYYPDIEIISVNPVGLKGLFKDVYTQDFLDDSNQNLKTEAKILNTNLLL